MPTFPSDRTLTRSTPAVDKATVFAAGNHTPESASPDATNAGAAAVPGETVITPWTSRAEAGSSVLMPTNPVSDHEMAGSSVTAVPAVAVPGATKIPPRCVDPVVRMGLITQHPTTALLFSVSQVNASFGFFFRLEETAP